MENSVKKKKALGVRRRNLFLTVLLAYPVIHFIIFYVCVNFNSVILAFQKYDADLNLSFAGFDNFVSIFKSFADGGSVFGRSIGNSLLFFFVTTILGFPLNMLFGFYLYKKTRGYSFIKFCVMIPSIVSGLVMALLFKFIITGPVKDVMMKFGWGSQSLLSNVNTVLGTMIFYTLWTGFSSSLIIYPNAMNAIDNEIVESASLDGATELEELWYITIPMILPTISTFFITGTAGMLAFSGPLFAFYAYSAPSQAWTSGYYLFRSIMGPSTTLMNYPEAATAGLILTFVSFPLTMIVKKLFDKLGERLDY